MVITHPLPENLIERILTHLGFTDFPDADRTGLRNVYSAWCRNIPFDNIHKRIHLASNAPGPLPGNDTVSFFENWLRYNIGGLCWAGNNALCHLLKSLGFTARHCLATMVIAEDIPPNHGTVVVELDTEAFLVDASLLHQQPLRLSRSQQTFIDHPAWGISCSYHGNKWHLQTRLLHMKDGCECRLDLVGAAEGEFHRYNEATRQWSPFNYSLYFRLNQDDSVVGLAYGKKVKFDRSGLVIEAKCDRQSQLKFLAEQVNINEEILERIPIDTPTPPPEPKLIIK